MAEPDPIGLSIVLPVYNDAASAELFVPQLWQLTAEQPGPCEIILVDDGGSDDLLGTHQRLSALRPANTVLRLVKLSRNFGKEAALSAGLAHARGQAVALMDADGQHPVSVLREMLNLYRDSDVEMVAAIQATRDHESGLLRSLKLGFYHFIQDSQRYQIKPGAGDFRLMGRKVVDALLRLPERQRFMKGLYAWVGFKTVYVPFQAEARNEGRSKFNYGGLFELALVAITSFSQRPLRWISRMGLLVSLASILYGVFIVAETVLFGRDLAGWSTLAAGIMFSAGVQLICLGVIGEYIGRIYEEVKQRPLYLVDRTWDSPDRDGGER